MKKALLIAGLSSLLATEIFAHDNMGANEKSKIENDNFQSMMHESARPDLKINIDLAKTYMRGDNKKLFKNPNGVDFGVMGKVAEMDNFLGNAAYIGLDISHNRADAIEYELLGDTLSADDYKNSSFAVKATTGEYSDRGNFYAGIKVGYRELNYGFSTDQWFAGVVTGAEKKAMGDFFLGVEGEFLWGRSSSVDVVGVINGTENTIKIADEMVIKSFKIEPYIVLQTSYNYAFKISYEYEGLDSVIYKYTSKAKFGVVAKF